MAKVDLHVHSCYSERPSEWFLQRLGTRESYVDPEEIYRTAKQEGMDFITITDHNTIEGAVRLKQKHPSDVIIGVEVTAYFPEDGAKVHILVWGLNEIQFRRIDKLRSNIYDLRNYLVEENLAHAVAHVTFAINRMLSFKHVERLFVLFDYFETHNGSREKSNTEVLEKVFTNLTMKKIRELSEKYLIQPVNAESWHKGRVGGSDDHSGLFVGKTFTYANASTPNAFLSQIKQKATFPKGRHNNYQGLAFAIYKVAYDFSQSKNPFAGTMLGTINSLLFDNKPVGLKKQALINKIKIAKWSKKDPVTLLLADFLNTLISKNALSTDEKLNLINTTLTKAADELVTQLFIKISQSLQTGDLSNLVKSISGFLPGIFLSVPFFTSLNVLNQSRWLIDALYQEYVKPENRRKKRVLWFTDTFLELSGVSATLQEMSRLALDRNLDMKILTCLPPANERNSSVPPNIIDLPCIHSYTPEFFNTYTLRLPSVMAALKIVSDAEPDEIYVSTPGPVGLLGILFSKLLHIPSTAVYHTDFTRQFRQIIGDETICQFTEDYVNWFHSLADTIAVPTEQYATQLERRGISRAKLRKFRRGIDPAVFAPVASSEYLVKTLGITDGITLLHSGRVSKEKNLDFLASVYEKILENHPKVNLIYAGDGPYYDEFRKKLSKFNRVYFTGRIDRCDLPSFYSASNLLVFPSITDTFGMVVLEAQACGLPAIVSDFGGPQEIILNGKTGFVAESNNCEDWVNKIEGVINMIESFPQLYLEMRVEARRHVMANYNWDLVLQDIFSRSKIIREKDYSLPYSDIKMFDANLKQEKLY